MRKHVRLFAVVAGLVLAGTAVAGYRTASPVFVDSTYRYLWGDLGATRNSADSVALLTVSVNADESGSTLYIFGRDIAHRQGSCHSTSPAFIAAAANAGGDGYVAAGWDQNGVCEYVAFQHSSARPPKAP